MAINDNERRKARQQADEIALIFKDTFFSIADEFADRMSDAFEAGTDRGFSATTVKSVERQIKDLGRSYDQLSRNQSRIIKGTLKERDIRAQILEFDKKREAVLTQMSLIADETSQEYTRLRRDLAAIEKTAEGLTQELENQIVALKRLNSQTAFFDSLAEAAKSIPGLGPLISGPFKEAQEAARLAALKTDDFITAFAAGIGTLGVSLGQTLLGPKGILITLVKVNDQVTEIGREFAISGASALKFRKELDSAAESTLVLTKELIAANFQLNNLVGIAGRFDEKLVTTFGELTTLLGLTEEEAGKLLLNTSNLNTSANDFTSALAESLVIESQLQGIAIGLKDAFQEVSNISAETALNLRRNENAIAAAVVQSRRLGLSFDVLENSADSLLDFESSIRSELEAELLTGRQLNLERARAAALTGDTVTLQRELGKNFGTLADFENQSVLARRAQAQALGMSVEELANILLKQEAVIANEEAALRLNAEQIRGARKLAEEEGITFGQALKNQAMQLSATQTLERFAGKLQQAFASLIQVIEPALNTVTKLVEKLSGNSFFATAAKSILGVGSTIAIVSSIMNFGKSIISGARGSTPANPMYTANVGGLGGDPNQLSLFPEGPVPSGKNPKGFKNSRMMGKFGKAGKYARFGRLAKFGGATALISSGINLGTNLMDDKLSTGDALMKTLDQNKFTALGAGIGALFGGIGAVPGAAIGGLLDVFANNAGFNGTYDDFIVRPGQKPMRFNKGDIVAGGTNLGGNNKGLEDKFDKLIALVEKGSVINMESRKVGTAMVLSGIKNA